MSSNLQSRVLTPPGIFYQQTCTFTAVIEASHVDADLTAHGTQNPTARAFTLLQHVFCLNRFGRSNATSRGLMAAFVESWVDERSGQCGRLLSDSAVYCSSHEAFRCLRRETSDKGRAEECADGDEDKGAVHSVVLCRYLQRFLYLSSDQWVVE